MNRNSIVGRFHFYDSMAKLNRKHLLDREDAAFAFLETARRHYGTLVGIDPDNTAHFLACLNEAENEMGTEVTR